MRQMACKPGSVLAEARDGHSSGTFVAERLARPTRTAAGNCHCRPYLVLLPVGLAVPPSLPKARCALTAPFQPCPDRNPTAVCFLLRFPWSRLRRTLSGTVFPWSPDFPPSFALARSAGRPSGHLTQRQSGSGEGNVNLAQQSGDNCFAFGIRAAIDFCRSEMALKGLDHS